MDVRYKFRGAEDPWMYGTKITKKSCNFGLRIARIWLETASFE
jgi:hypothetical protein